MPNSLTVGGTDRVDLNITALNSHDGTSAFRILVTPVRVVCANTQSAALRGEMYSIGNGRTHTGTRVIVLAEDRDLHHRRRHRRTPPRAHPRHNKRYQGTGRPPGPTR